jgi:Sulfotransferase family
VRTPWPNLFLVGAPRCGTTSLFTYLAAHPDVFGPEEKEPHYYDRDLLGTGAISDDEYAALFAGSSSARWRLDASTFYLYSPGAPAAIARDAPDARILVAIRDPVELVASWHRLVVASGGEPIVDLASAIEAEPARREGRGVPPNVAPACLMYTEIGAFAKHVVRWRDAFGDRVDVVRLEDLQSRPYETSARLLRSLGLDPVGGAFPHLNPARRAMGVAVWMNRSSLVRSAARRLVPQRARRAVWNRVNRTLTPYSEREPVDAVLRRHLERLFAPELELLERTE